MGSESRQKPISVERYVVKSTYTLIPGFYKRVLSRNRCIPSWSGAVLTQVYEIEGKKRSLPVDYASWSLKGAERKYSVTDQEALAVVWAVKTINLYIMGTHFTTITKHNVLKALKN